MSAHGQLSLSSLEQEQLDSFIGRIGSIGKVSEEPHWITLRVCNSYTTQLGHWIKSLRSLFSHQDTGWDDHYIFNQQWMCKVVGGVMYGIPSPIPGHHCSFVVVCCYCCCLLLLFVVNWLLFTTLASTTALLLKVWKCTVCGKNHGGGMGTRLWCSCFTLG